MKCSVCGLPAKQFHFGSKSYTCKACAAFFRRFFMSPKLSISCKIEGKCKTDLKLLKTFITQAFPEFSQAGKFEMKSVFLNFFVKYTLIEPPYLSLMTGCDKLLLPNGDFYNDDIASLYGSGLKSQRISKEQTEE
ncbi:unnamed protein product [Caenorhabditis bovis]|uniref:Nuclear receptor domain-containing protein n=1 Tax=Caenorhabditis bovis TaxID=2654633 RepID=A0A8S1EAP4_9PELO|nr:unnamed protein product [Caenorhabditis bovis]